MNKVVARYADGRIVKGVTGDFSPAKDAFHVIPESPATSKPMGIRTSELKALFFVKDFSGDPQYNERKEFNPSRPPVGRKIRVLFKNGELLVGTTNGYQPGRPGFFVVPADPGSNNERCYVVSAATQEVAFM